MSKYLRARGKPRMERVLTPSLSIIYPPYSQNLEKDLFMFFSPFPLLDKRKVGGNSCLPRHLRIKNAKLVLNSWFCHRITSGIRMDKSIFLQVDLNRVGYKDEPFILASQAKQVFYVTDLTSTK